MHRVFVVGSERSGTTLTGSILGLSDRFARYRAESLLLTVGPRRYGSLTRATNRERFLADWFGSRQFGRSGLDREEFLEIFDESQGDWTRLLRLFLDRIAEKQGRCGWCDSTPAHVFCADEILREMPNARFVHVIRDGRAVAVSRVKLGWTGMRTSNPDMALVGAGLAWQQAVRAGRQAARRHPDAFLEIRYERLVEDLPSELARLNEFLGTEIHPDQVSADDDRGIGANTAFGDVESRGLSSAPTERWKRSLSKAQVQLLDHYLGDLLRELGYPTERAAELRGIHTSGRWLLPAYLDARLWAARHTPLGRLTGLAFEPHDGTDE